MLADRGQCSFVTKVRNIENAGMAVAIVVDSRKEDVNNIIMSDDGTGAGLRIPSMLISHSDGAKLIDFMNTASVEELQAVNVIASFDSIDTSSVVRYDLWYSSSSDDALDFLTNFAKIDEHLGEKVILTPRFVFWECYGCDKSFLDQHCYGGGKYCATELSLEDRGGITGRDIVLEDLRQLCIYQDTYKDPSDISYRSKFWKYIKTIHQECGSLVNLQCSKFAHREAGLDFEDTDKCVKKSFRNLPESEWAKESSNNTLIDQQIAYWMEYGSSLFPSVVINNVTFRGQLETQAVMNAVCAGFSEPPRVCKKILTSRDIEKNLNVGVVWYDDGYSTNTLVYILIAGVVGLCLTLCCYRRYAKRQMKEQMES